MNQDITILDLPATTVISKRFITSLETIAEDMGKVFTDLLNELTEAEAAMMAPPFALYYCEDFDPKHIDTEVCLPVSPNIAKLKDKIKTIEAVQGGASIIHKGPYNTTEPSYCKLFTWINGNEKVKNGPIREIYLNDPDVVKPEEILTQIVVPV
ncbi:GyrI-like domain-containing protein [Desulfovibrio litoralis]|uniref:Effector-binding domain-containing protein n=1 Tax=Desulfovibrio litoralis DSM 11393 TaxID=1121455 RepID=A0A1M7TFE0_9BACT|nr:GyrI-like domain-containing protein [Desulfovibrio litoralis]SHN69479.1 effector-binding domain-containing protein [Desulfovibrio litoralis DSM 11393]